MNFSKESAGTVAWGCGASSALQLATVDMSGNLSVLQFNPLQKLEPFEALGQTALGQMATSLVWTESAGYEAGLAGAGLLDGSFALFDLGAAIDGRHAELGRAEIGASVCAEASPSKPLSVLVGGEGAAVVDFENNFASPIVTRLSDSSERVTSVGWNKGKAVPHILCFASDTGKINVFDLKMKKIVSSFKDSRELGGKSVRATWNPANPLQLAACFEDADAGVQIWDLRNAKAPVKRLNTGAAISLDWAKNKPSTLLLALERGVFSELNYETDENKRCERPGFNTAYAKYLPHVEDSFYAVSQNGDLEVIASEKPLKSAALRSLPRIAAPQASALPLGNGSLFLPGRENPFAAIRGEAAEPRLASLASVLRSESATPAQIAANLTGLHPSSTLSLILHSEKPAEEKLEFIGISPEETLRTLEHINSTSYGGRTESVRPKALNAVSETETLDFFSELAQEGERPASEIFEQPEASDLEKVETLVNHDFRRGFEKLLRDSILLNLPEAAVDCALRAHRIFEAFMIAHAHPQLREALVARISEKVAAAAPADVTNLLKLASLPADSTGLAGCFAAAEWKDMVTFVLRKAKGAKEREAGLGMVVEKLRGESALHADFLTSLLLAGRFDAFLEQLVEGCDGGLESLAGLFELALLVHAKTRAKPKGPAFNALLLRAVAALVENRHISAAYTLLSIFADSSNEKLAQLKHNLYFCYEDELKPTFSEPAALNKKNFNFPLRKKKTVVEAAKKGPNPFAGSKPVLTRPPEPVAEEPVNPPRAQANPFKAKIDAPAPVSVHTPAPSAPQATRPAPPRPGVPIPPPKMPQPVHIRPPVVAPPPSMPPSYAPKQEAAPVQTPIDSPSVPPSATVTPPPPPRRAVPPPPPRSVPAPTFAAPTHAPPSQKITYDPKKSAEIIDFAKRGPSFVSEIEKNPVTAKIMNDSLIFLEHSIKNNSLPLTQFDGFHRLVEMIGEDKIDEAKSLANVLSSQFSGESAHALNTIKKFLSVL